MDFLKLASADFEICKNANSCFFR
jgi:hypothetical protein